MRKTILIAALLTTTIYADNQFYGCVELPLNHAKSIVTCPHGDYEVTFKIYEQKRDQTEPPVIKKIGEPKGQIIQYINKQDKNGK